MIRTHSLETVPINTSEQAKQILGKEEARKKNKQKTQ